MNGTAYPMNNELHQRLLEIVSELSRTRTGLHFLDRYFTEPITFASTLLPGSPGVYAILMSDAAWQPRPYRPIYFGEAADLAGRALASHEKYEEWLRAAGAADQLYVAYHLTSGDEAGRAALKESLIKEYRPACNEDSGIAAGSDPERQLSSRAVGI
jgi:hypothetical protein